MQKNLTQGPITKTLVIFALPMIGGNMLQQLYNIADTLIVGRFIGSEALAAVGSSLHTDDLSHIYPAGAVHGQRGGFLHPLRRGRYGKAP